MVNLMIVDPQNDFCLPGAPLEVKGAMVDIRRISKYIRDNGHDVNDIWITMDMHPFLHIANANFWYNKLDVQRTSEYNRITPDMIDEIVFPAIDIPFDELKEIVSRHNGGAVMAWPPHCIMGTPGANIVDELFEAVTDWSLANGKNPHIVLKGMDQLKEEYSAFGVVADTNIDKLIAGDLTGEWLVGGQAMDVCVVSTVTDICGFIPAKNITVIGEWGSWIGTQDPKMFTDLGVNFAEGPVDGN